jgi:hypothetical protein
MWKEVQKQWETNISQTMEGAPMLIGLDVMSKKVIFLLGSVSGLLGSR